MYLELDNDGYLTSFLLKKAIWQQKYLIIIRLISVAKC